MLRHDENNDTYNPNIHCDRCQEKIGYNVTLRYPDKTEVIETESLLCIHCFKYYKAHMTEKEYKWFEITRKTKIALGQA